MTENIWRLCCDGTTRINWLLSLLHRRQDIQLWSLGSSTAKGDMVSYSQSLCTCWALSSMVVLCILTVRRSWVHIPLRSLWGVCMFSPCLREFPPTVNVCFFLSDNLKPIAAEERRIEEEEKKAREEQERIAKQLAEGSLFGLVHHASTCSNICMLLLWIIFLSSSLLTASEDTILK